MVRRSLSALAALAMVLAACTSTPGPEAATESQSPAPPTPLVGYPGPEGTSVFRTPQAPVDLPTPTAGRAVLGGALYSFTSDMLIPGTLIYLTPGVGPDSRDFPLTVVGPDDAKGDIRGQTNADGQFVLVDVPPGNYFLVVATFTWSFGVAAAGEAAPMLIEVKADQTQSVGIVYVSWP